MPGTADGALKTAAKRTGLSVEEYLARTSAGGKWCTACKAWHPIDAFPRDRTRGDGRRARCLASDRGKGQRDVDPQRQKAYNALKRALHNGTVRPANEHPCTDCGHVWTPGDRRHEYDHARGYDDMHLLDVEPVCTTCHAAREMQRRAA